LSFVLGLTDPRERSAALPTAWFKWIKPFFHVKDDYVLNHVSLDAFLFLRFLKILSLICSVGCLLTWPTLITLHTRGGGSETQLDALTIGNVTKSYLYYAHVVVACCFFGT
jgi:hypothetical protein